MTGPEEGTVFRFTPGAPATLSALASFGAASGVHAPTILIGGADGNLYGLTAGRGASGSVDFFRMSRSGIVTILATLTADQGADPVGLVEAADGSFYGTTLRGGPGNGGVVFRVTAGSVTNIATFTTGDIVNGDVPLGGVIQGPDGDLYGTTSSGGAGGFGTVFKIALGGAAPALTTILSFDGANGRMPAGALVDGGDGRFYATTRFGGAGDAGTVFAITPAGGLTSLVSFAAAGPNPSGGLVRSIDGSFYGRR